MAAPASAQAPQSAARGPGAGAAAQGAGRSAEQQPAAEPASLQTGAGAAAGQQGAEQPATGRQSRPSGGSAAPEPVRAPAGPQPRTAAGSADPRLAAAPQAAPRSWELLTQVDEGCHPAAKLPWEAARAGDTDMGKPLRAPQALPQQPDVAQVQQSAGAGLDSQRGAGGVALMQDGVGLGVGPAGPGVEAGAGQPSPMLPQQRVGTDAAHAVPIGSPEPCGLQGVGRGADAVAARGASAQALGQPREFAGPGGVADPGEGLGEAVRSSPAFSSQPPAASPDVVARLDFGAGEARAHEDAEAASCALPLPSSFTEVSCDPWRPCKGYL